MTKIEMIKMGRKFHGEYLPELDEPMFICPECGELVSFNNLEVWSDDSDEDILNNRVICSFCYENEMGDDL